MHERGGVNGHRHTQVGSEQLCSLCVQREENHVGAADGEHIAQLVQAGGVCRVLELIHHFVAATSPFVDEGLSEPLGQCAVAGDYQRASPPLFRRNLGDLFRLVLQLQPEHVEFGREGHFHLGSIQGKGGDGYEVTSRQRRHRAAREWSDYQTGSVLHRSLVGLGDVERIVAGRDDHYRQARPGVNMLSFEHASAHGIRRTTERCGLQRQKQGYMWT